MKKIVGLIDAPFTPFYENGMVLSCHGKVARSCRRACTQFCRYQIYIREPT